MRDLTIRLQPKWARCLCVKHGAEECEGPCYDFCSCRHCWNGWKEVPFRTRLNWRIRHILRDLKRGIS